MLLLSLDAIMAVWMDTMTYLYS